MVIMYLTCAHKNEAHSIAKALLEKKLIACARHSPVRSSYWWDGAINNNDEILVMMESIEEKFDAIVTVLNEMHSYDQYVLTAVTVSRTTLGVEKWLKDSLT
jgi:periplasmic divalent cation tolerance protein